MLPVKTISNTKLPEWRLLIPTPILNVGRKRVLVNRVFRGMIEYSGSPDVFVNSIMTKPDYYAASSMLYNGIIKYDGAMLNAFIFVTSDNTRLSDRWAYRSSYSVRRKYISGKHWRMDSRYLAYVRSSSQPLCRNSRALQLRWTYGYIEATAPLRCYPFRWIASL
jgi:hypothetical protein